MDRREYLAVTGGMIAIAGCSGSSNDEEESEGEANFVLTDVSPDSQTFDQGDSIRVSATIENIGESEGEKILIIDFREGTVDMDRFTIEPGEEQEYTTEINTEGIDSGEYNLWLHTEDDEVNREIIIEEDQPQTEDTPEQTEDQRLLEALADTLAVEGLTPVEYYIDGNEAYLHYETQSTSQEETVDEISFVSGAYAGVVEEGISTDKLVAELSQPGGSPTGRYEVDTEWAEKYNSGEYEQEEYQVQIIGTFENI